MQGGINVLIALLYGGKPIIQSENLYPAPTETLYDSERKGLRNQFHDVSKYEMQGKRIKLQYTLENETGCDYKMILRKAGYEGAIYREQYDKKTKETYPVVGTILYWGRKNWNAPKNIHSFFRKRKLPREVLRYVNNVQLQVFCMYNLPVEIRQRFHSDMRIVVDYLAEEKDYVPTQQKLKHPEALLRMMQNLTGDERFLKILDTMQENERKGGVAMCELLDRYWNDGVTTGMQKGIQDGIKALVETCQEFGISREDTAERIRQKFSTSLEDAKGFIQEYWK